MRKSIKTIIGIKEVTVEEALDMYKNMVHKFAHTCKNQLESFSNDFNDIDDYFQIGSWEVVNCFNNYDIENGVCFSTYLTKCLNNRLIHLKRDLLAKKRKNKQFVYIDKPVDNGDMTGNLVEVIADSEAHSFMEEYDIHDEEKLEEFLSKHLTKEEIKMFIINVRKHICDSECLDCFLAEVGQVPTKKADLAIEFGLSRPTLNSRIEKTMEKIKGLTNEYLEMKFR